MSMFTRNLLPVFLFLMIFSSFSCEQKPDYLNTQLSFEERADDLLSLLTLEEKVSLMQNDSPAIERLDIPAYNWWNECLHGVARSGLATVFPQAIGMAAMWDRKEMFDIATVISDEARAKHHQYIAEGKRGIFQGLTFWTPNINIFRDPRWGRGMETYGEDPFLTAEMAIPFIKGLQGEDEKYMKTVATVKHFAAHSGPEFTRHSADIYPSDYDLSETYLPHFMRCVKEAKVYSVMCAYQRLRGEPCCGDLFLDHLLREEWGFEGYIVSDCGAISDFYREDAHHVVKTPEEAAAKAVKAGTDLNCGSVYSRGLADAVRQNLITESEIDLSVKRLLIARMKLGMFDPEADVKYAQIPVDVLDSENHRLAALRAAHKSMVLLKNEDSILPFSKKVRKVAVIGPNADDSDVLYGNYNGYASGEVTPFKGIRDKLPDAEVTFAPGCPLAEKLPYLTSISPDYLFTDKTLERKGLNAEYFDNNTFEGTPAHVCVDKNIDFIWWNKAPYEDLPDQQFGVKWKGILVPPVTGEYAIGTEALNGYKLMINGKIITDGRDYLHPRKIYDYVELTAGEQYEIEVHYFQDNSEYAHIKVIWDIPNPDLEKEAVELAENSDLVILCMGLSPRLEGEEMPIKVEGFQGGDRLNLNLPQTQTNLIRKIHALNKPTVLVLLNGSALAINRESDNIPAIIEAWYPGQSGGTALADVIFGDYNPSGRLPVTFYKGIEQIPDFSNYDMKGKTYRYFEGEPLFEFGYGLSYTKFHYKMKHIPSSIKTGESISLSVDVTNTGDMDGDEVIQLYISLPESELNKPVRSLQNFKRIHLKKGETRTVEFTLQPKQFAARNSDNLLVVEPGKVQISVGGKQPDDQSINQGKVVQQLVSISGENFYIAD